MDPLQFVTVLIPCRNEKKFIEPLINNILRQDYPSKMMEILIIDGCSDDGTVEIIKKYSYEYNHIVLMNNPDKTVPFALNMGIKESKGEIIIRMDAHSIYPDNYISQLVYHSVKIDADNVGGVWITTESTSTNKAKAIALATSNPFGIGNAMYRLNAKEIIEVDTVPFGCYKKEVFMKIGLFDEELIRNQDDEFNARLKQNGGKIFLIPSIKIKYFARENFKKMFKMFYQYGLFKPLVNRKLKKPSSIRQFIPLFFVIYLFCIPISLIFKLQFFCICLIPLFVYLLANLIISINISVKNKNPLLLPHLMLSFFLTHFAYGYGYLSGIFKFLIFRSSKIKKEIKPNR